MSPADGSPPTLATVLVELRSLSAVVEEVKGDVKAIETCLNEGNGKLPLRTEVLLNTRFREEYEADRRRIRNVVLGAIIGLATSGLLLGVNIWVTLASNSS